MPFYGFRCSNGHYKTHYAKIADRDNSRQCDGCGANLHRLIEAPALRPEIQAYQSPIDGRWINSRAQRTEDLARSGSIPWEPEMKQDIERNRLANQEKAFEPLDRCIEQTARDLVAAGKMDPL